MGPVSRARKQTQRKKPVARDLTAHEDQRQASGRFFPGSLQRFVPSLVHASERARGDYKPLEGETKFVTPQAFAAWPQEGNKPPASQM